MAEPFEAVTSPNTSCVIFSKTQMRRCRARYLTNYSTILCLAFPQRSMPPRTAINHKDQQIPYPLDSAKLVRGSNKTHHLLGIRHKTSPSRLLNILPSVSQFPNQFHQNCSSNPSLHLIPTCELRSNALSCSSHPHLASSLSLVH
jgi:hypothetical protein